MENKYKHAEKTPMMRQWLEIKQQMKQNEIVFCRVGDFYELFYDDAERASKILDIQLTKRKIADSTYPMAGVPHRSLDNYVARLIKKGYKVAIIDQLEDAKMTKGTIKRGLTRIVTKGTITEDLMLSPKENNYLAAITHISRGKSKTIGFAVCDLTTGDFRAGEFAEDKKSSLLRGFIKYSPVELLYQQDLEKIDSFYSISVENDILTPIPAHWFEIDYAKKIVYDQFKIKTSKGFGIDDDSVAVGAAGALLRYIKETQFTEFNHILSIKSFDIEDTMTLDAAAIKSLELFTNTQDNTSYATLLDLLDEAATPMGSRLIRSWLANPLTNRDEINQRLNAVSLFVGDTSLHQGIRSLFSRIGDIERLITRISMGKAKPSELINLVKSLELLPGIKTSLEPLQSHFPDRIIERIDTCEDIIYAIKKSIRKEPSNVVGEGLVIKPGYNSELDRLMALINEGDSWLGRYIESLKQSTGIENIKINQNNTLGYFIEISKKHIAKVPAEFERKQAMVNFTRYVTHELKQWEGDVLTAQIQILEIENKLYKSILNELCEFIPVLQITSQSIATLDALQSHAYLAERRNYRRPEIRDDNAFIITGGRHPVIEAINSDQPYTGNNIILDYETQRILIITGPNFSGKSSLLRTTALIAIMAQMGSFVPAEHVEIGPIDRIFTRIGASDNLVAGQSTFMHEMIDAANLVNNSTERSLIIADELGRGTSTYDGLAIAWSITEYLHNLKNPPKALIATHYHQLAELEQMLPFCKNYHFTIKFVNDEPVFDHKLTEGATDKSFGVEVAKLAGLPGEVLDRSRYILEILESKAASVNPESLMSKKLVDIITTQDGQLSIDNWFGGQDEPSKKHYRKKILKGEPILKERKEEPLSNREIIIAEIMKELTSMELNDITPMDALALLSKYKERLDE